MSTTQPIPVLLCGRHQLTAETVTKHLQPEFAVVHFISDVSVAKEDIGPLLDGNKPKHSNTWGIGTGDYTQPPQAVILGSAYGADAIKEIRGAVVDGKRRGVPWMVSGMTKEQSERAKAERVRDGSTKEYAARTANQIKTVLLKVLGGDSGSVDGVHTYHV